MKKSIVKSKYIHLKAIAFSLCFIPGAFTLSSCKKFVEIPAPNTQLVTSSVFDNNAAASSALTVIYTEMFTNGESFAIASENGSLSDELTNNAGSGLQYYTNAMVANGNGIIYGDWNNVYSYIYQANAIIAGLQQYAGVSPAVKQQLTGEAYFLRGFWLFYLTNTYGAVPLTLTTNFNVNDVLSRTPRVLVLQQVVSDLQQAQSLLNSNYVGVSDTITTTERTQPNKATATALLARAYLYLGDYNSQNATDYQKADSAATAVIGNSAYSLCTNLSGANSVFLKNSSETIWQLATPLPASYDTPDGYGFVLLGAPYNFPNIFTISPQLLNAFEAGDQRKLNWVGSITAAGQTYYYPYKYKNDTYQGTEYTMVLRLAEQYLIRAEARVREEELSGAGTDLNMIRTRAGLPNTTAKSASDLLTAILHERQVELFTEWGTRWFDLNRTGNAPAVLGSPGNVCQFKGGTWNPDNYQQLYPIPQNEIKIDYNLSQNPGY